MIKCRVVTLKPIRKEDIDLLQKWFYENSTAVRFLGSNFGSIEEVRKFFEDSLANSHSRRDFLIETNNEKKLIGAISLENINWKFRTTEAAIILGQKGFRRREFIYDTFIEIFDYAFNDLNLHKLQMKFLGFNQRMLNIVHEWLDESIKDPELIPIKREGILKEAAFYNGRYYDVYVYGILKDDYNKIRKDFVNCFVNKYLKQ